MAATASTPRGSRPWDLSLYFVIIVILFGSISIFLGGGHAATILNDATVLQLDSFKSSSSSTPMKKPYLPAIPAEEKETTSSSSSQFQLAGLSCEAYGGPADAHEMVYWHDIPSDRFVQLWHGKGVVPQFLSLSLTHIFSSVSL